MIGTIVIIEPRQPVQGYLRERDFLIDDLLDRIHLTIEMILVAVRWNYAGDCVFLSRGLQGYLAHKEAPYPRALH